MPVYQVTANARYGYKLVLNPMKGGIEGFKEFGPFDTLGLLQQFYEGEKVPLYKDEGPDMYGGGTKSYSKSFRKGGPLEWFNPLSNVEINWNNEDGFANYHGHGVHLVPMDVYNIQRQYKIG